MSDLHTPDLHYCFVLGCSGSGKSLLTRPLSVLDGVLVTNERVIPTFLAHLFNQPLNDTIRSTIERGVANHLRTYLRSGPSGSRVDALVRFLTLRSSMKRFRRQLAKKGHDL